MKYLCSLFVDCFGRTGRIPYIIDFNRDTVIIKLRSFSAAIQQMSHFPKVSTGMTEYFAAMSEFEHRFIDSKLVLFQCIAAHS